MFRRLPFGISSAPEYFQKRMNSEVSGLTGVVCHLDYILVIGRNQREHDERLRAVLDRLVTCGLTLNVDKCAFSQSELSYLSQIIDGDEFVLIPERSRRSSICQNLPTSLKFCPDLAEKTHALQEMLIKQNAWIWGQPQKHAFNILNDELSSNRVLALYDPKRKTIVSADASSFGLGCVLPQRQLTGEMRPVAYTSRSITHIERTYLLAIDCYSRDVDICLVTNKVDTSETSVKLKKVFSRHVIPDIMFSDNGPQFDS